MPFIVCLLLERKDIKDDIYILWFPIIPYSTQQKDDDKPSGSDDKVSKPNRFVIAQNPWRRRRSGNHEDCEKYERK